MEFIHIEICIFVAQAQITFIPALLLDRTVYLPEYPSKPTEEAKNSLQESHH
jgi:hypothetical protein